MKRDARRQLVIVTCAAMATMIQLAGRADNEVHVYGIAQFGGTGKCGSSSQTHVVHTQTAAAFAETFQDLKANHQWDSVCTLNNGKARGSYFTDKDKASSCSCTADDLAKDAGADEADVIYVHTHGGHSQSPWESSLLMGNSKYDCSVTTHNNMLWNSDLEIAVIKACQSGDFEVFENKGYFDFIRRDSGFSMWNAFHGDSSCGSFVTSYVRTYAKSSVHEGVGENWIDAAYDKVPGRNNDDCPVSIVFASSVSKAHALFYHGGWLDRKATGSKTLGVYYFISGCNPTHGVKLP